MASKHRLRKDHAGMVLNCVSFNQEKDLGKALRCVCLRLAERSVFYYFSRYGESTFTGVNP